MNDFTVLAVLSIYYDLLLVVFRGRPLLFWSQYNPDFLYFTIAWCTAVLLTPSFSLIFLSDWPSLHKITTWARWLSVKDAFLPIFYSRKKEDNINNPLATGTKCNLTATISLRKGELNTGLLSIVEKRIAIAIAIFCFSDYCDSNSNGGFSRPSRLR